MALHENVKIFDLRQRTKAFALRVIKLHSALPTNPLGWTLGRQLLRSGTSVGANYREAQRARTGNEFASKMQIVLQELDETAYWLEPLEEGGIMPKKRLQPLREETEELIAVIAASVRTAKRRTRGH